MKATHTLTLTVPLRIPAGQTLYLDPAEEAARAATERLKALHVLAGEPATRVAECSD